MERFIEKTFKILLHRHVKVFFRDEESYQIHILNPQNKDYTEEEFFETYPEFSIFRIPKSEKWGYDCLKQTFSGDYWTPPDWDYIECKIEYNDMKGSLYGLIQEIIGEDWDELLMFEEEKKYN